MEWCSEEFDKLNKEATVEQDPAKRSDYYIQIQQLEDGEVHTIWTVHPASFFAARKGIVPSMTPNGVPYAWDFGTE